ncbi:large-conductance mechanosensitive channel [Methanococcus maripaludis]|uniref:Large-conductance mechanosensitive channel n=1 Tax=Methanococcus maripaludis TaxID=39152 RepID=A0A7J9PB17_METMI|nr:hypothetical protein [Methanococcus maripaludis]MBA2858649.1 large-conductance mechanosensitive channel [Methanococcus maripaludis]
MLEILVDLILNLYLKIIFTAFLAFCFVYMTIQSYEKMKITYGAFLALQITFGILVLLLLQKF